MNDLEKLRTIASSEMTDAQEDLYYDLEIQDELGEDYELLFNKDCTCWEGYERVPGTKPCGPGSCKKK